MSSELLLKIHLFSQSGTRFDLCPSLSRLLAANEWGGDPGEKVVADIWTVKVSGNRLNLVLALDFIVTLPL